MTRITRLFACLWAALAFAAPSMAIDRIRLNVEEIVAGPVTAQGFQASLAIASSRRSTLTVAAREVDLPSALRAQVGRLTQFSLRCETPLVREPDFNCPRFTLDAHAARLPPLHLEGELQFDSSRVSMHVAGVGPTLANVPLSFVFDGTPSDWDATASLPPLTVKEIADLVAPWATPPSEHLPAGRAALSLQAQSRDGTASATLAADLTDIDYANAEGTVVADKLRGRLGARVLSLETLESEVSLEITAGQFLAGPVFADLAANPVQLDVRAARDGEALQIAALDLKQRDLARLGGTARLRLEPFAIEAAQIEVKEVRLPAAYRSLLQILLTTTPFAQLETQGTARGAVRIVENQPVAIDLALGGVSFSDQKQQLEVRGVDGELHWTAGVTGPPRPSYVEWQSARGWGVTGGRSRLDFALQDRDVRLLKPARLPLWDGALVVSELEAVGIATPRFSGSFDARIEPISLQQVTRAFGWPEFNGKLSGRIPGLTYRDAVLTLQGDLEADLFDGRVTARQLRVRDPLGSFPRLYGDFTARNLDLDLITRTFEFGNITGRLDGDLTGLETFNWSPVAFDLRLATPADDRSRHRISQKAVKNLSSIGGGGGGVAAALQSGALRFFENFRYDRIGLSCRLRNDICEMNGVEPAKTGYYIVKGSGLPRIDIIGNQTRVDWPLLLAQVTAALENKDDIVVD